MASLELISYKNNIIFTNESFENKTRIINFENAK